MINAMNNQRGIALIQVLLITAILTVLAIYLTQTARDQVTLAVWADDKTEALVLLHSTESELLFTLLTQSKVQATINIDNNIDFVNQWNFFAKPFSVGQTVTDAVTITIQDQAGLINLHFPNSERLRALIETQGFSKNTANQVVDSLLDWQDLDNVPRVNGAETQAYNGKIRNGAIPDRHDLLFIKQMTPRIFKLLLKNSTIYSPGYYNPFNSPEALLQSVTDSNIATQIVRLRYNRQLTITNFSQLTGIQEDESTYFYPSNFLSIKFKSKIGESQVQKTIKIQLQPYAESFAYPIIFYSNRG